MTADRDRLAADLHDVLKWAGMGDFNVVADIVADRLIALGWTRLDAPPFGTRLVLVSEDADTLFFGRSERGNRLTFAWGEPDEHGWYTPTITEHNDEPLPLDEERLARAIDGYQLPPEANRPMSYVEARRYVAAAIAKVYREEP